MAFPDKFITELVERNDIVSVVSEYVNLSRRSGANMFGLCPFHSEKTPSFSVSPSKQIYHCFGCGKGGGVINFVMEIENLSYPDAVRKLAERAGLTVPEEEYDPNSKKRARMYELNKSAARFFYDTLNSPAGAPAREYITGRQISRTTATNFGLGFAPDTWHSLVDAMKAQGFTDFELIDAGLAKKGKNGGSYDAFRNRLIFPVIDVRGNVIAFSGRILGDGEPKYLNTSQTLVFDKGRNLFALNRAKNSKLGYIILCEGNVDVVSMHQAGFDSAVASLGTSLTEQQAQLISRYTDRVVIAYDSDAAGRKATDRAMNIFKKLDVKVQVLTVKGAKDPDEFIKLKGAEAFRQLLEESENQIDYRLRLIEEQYDLTQPDQKTQYASEAEKLIAGLPTAAERQIYSGVIAGKISVSTATVFSDVENLHKRRLKGMAHKEQRDAVSGAGKSRYENPASAVSEKGIIRLLYLDPALINEPGLPDPGEFTDSTLASLYSLILERLRRNEPVSIPVLGGLADAECISQLVEIAEQPENLSTARETLRDYISALKKNKMSGWENISDIISRKQAGQNKR